MPPKIVIVCGPTAAGKTKLGVALAHALDGEVVSADSMQIYRGMEIGTAAPTPEEREGIPHHMIGVADPRESYSVARYVEEASACVDTILARGRLPLVVGGTGLYLDALRRGRAFSPFSPEIRAKLQEQVRAQGLPALWHRLEETDPQTAARLHPHDEKRILRALEVFEQTGKPLSRYNAETARLPPRYDAAVIALTFRDRADLKARIDRRVDEMMAGGLTHEVRRLLAEGVSPTCTAMQAIGYQELAAVIDSGQELTAAIEEIKLHSRQYAKRQLTWFRRIPDAHWIFWEKIPDIPAAVQDSTAFLRGFGLG